MLGWLLGLGDRHLDNLLLDTDSGELLHIDFSVCFDKGAGLAVPEVVPFRLTQMMQVGQGTVAFAWPAKWPLSLGNAGHYHLHVGCMMLLHQALAHQYIMPMSTCAACSGPPSPAGCS